MRLQKKVVLFEAGKFMTKERTGSGPGRLGAEPELELGLGTSPQFCPLWPVILFSENGSRCLTATVQSRSTKKIQLPISVLWVTPR